MTIPLWQTLKKTPSWGNFFECQIPEPAMPNSACHLFLILNREGFICSRRYDRLQGEDRLLKIPGQDLPFNPEYDLQLVYKQLLVLLVSAGISIPQEINNWTVRYNGLAFGLRSGQMTYLVVGKDFHMLHLGREIIRPALDPFTRKSDVFTPEFLWDYAYSLANRRGLSEFVEQPLYDISFAKTASA